MVIKLLKSEIEYLRTRLIVSACWGAGIILILAILNQIFDGKMPFEENGFIPLIYFWSILPAFAIGAGTGGYKIGNEFRVGMHMMLPVSRLEVGVVSFVMYVLGMLVASVGWWTVALIAGVISTNEELTNILLIQAGFLGFWGVISIVIQSKHSRVIDRWIAQILQWSVMIAVFLLMGMGKPLFEMMKRQGTDVSGMERIIEETVNWTSTTSGIGTIYFAAVGACLLAIFQFTRRVKFLPK